MSVKGLKLDRRTNKSIARGGRPLRLSPHPILSKRLCVARSALDHERFVTAGSCRERERERERQTRLLQQYSNSDVGTRTKAGLIRTPERSGQQLFNANGGVIALAAKPT